MAGSDRTSYALGFTDLEQEVVVDRLPVEGKMPAWLSGALLRTGPAKYDLGRQTVNHWFDGMAMLHRFGFSGGEVSYRNRFLQSTSYREASSKGALARGEFATDPCRTLFQRVAAVFEPIALTDNGNVNINPRGGGALAAFTETTLPVRFDAETLATLGDCGYGPDVGGAISIAHPHHDARRKCQFSYVVEFGMKSRYRLFSIDDEDGAERVVAELPIDKPAYMHSFAMTEQHLVLVEFPLVVDPLRLKLQLAPFIRNYRWTPERGLRLHVFDKDGGGLVKSVETDPIFAFHHVNAFEERGNLVVDLIAYRDAGIIDQLYLDRLRASDPIDATGHLTRLIVPLESPGDVFAIQVADDMIELPRIDYDLCAGRPYRCVWGVGRRDVRDFLDTIIKIDTVTGETRSWWREHCYPGEPVFVPTPGRTREGDGVLLSVVLDVRIARSFLLVLDATSLAETARAECPHHIPFGFHGNYFPA